MKTFQYREVGHSKPLRYCLIASLVHVQPLYPYTSSSSPPPKPPVGNGPPGPVGNPEGNPVGNPGIPVGIPEGKPGIPVGFPVGKPGKPVGVSIVEVSTLAPYSGQRQREQTTHELQSCPCPYHLEGRRWQRRRRARRVRTSL